MQHNQQHLLKTTCTTTQGMPKQKSVPQAETTSVEPDPHQERNDKGSPQSDILKIQQKTTMGFADRPKTKLKHEQQQPNNA